MPRSRKSTDKPRDENKDNTNVLSPVTSPGSRGTHEFNTPKTIKSPLSIQSNSPRQLIRKQIFSPSLTKQSGSTPGTPIRQRSDIRVDSKLRQLQLNTDQRQKIGGLENKLVIWGTNIVLSECKQKIHQFLTSFIPLNLDENQHFDINQPLYLQKLEQIQITQKPFLVIDGNHLKTFDTFLYNQLICYPQEIIPAFDNVVNEIYFSKFDNSALEHQIQIRVMNIDQTKNMRLLNPDDVDQLISINGMVVRTSNVIPEMQEAYYECYICKNHVVTEINAGKIVEPSLCSVCNNTHSMVLIHNRSIYCDKQIIKVQESPDEMPAGQTPYNVLLFAFNDLVDEVQPGDRVTITGIFRAVGTKINPRQSILRSVYKTYIDVIHFKKYDKAKLHIEGGEKVCLSDSRIREIVRLSKFSNIYEKLANSLAPSVYGNHDVKKGLLLQLFGGTKKEFTASNRSNFRSQVNILLCGDPGTCKSQLLKYMYNLLPRGQYTSGKGSSAVGLTAYVTRDPDTRQLILQTGSLVLSDNGICCIDEFDKMSQSTRSVLHEVMEQQTLSIAKAGIICQLNARTSILAAANPVKSRWDTKLTTIANIQMSHTLLSRFDLIFLILDHQSEVFDKNLAHHLVNIYKKPTKSVEEVSPDDVDMPLLKDYIAYARENIHPKLTEESADHLIQSYTEMRRFGNQHGSISAYPRQLESLIRLSEAHAKVRLSNKVEVIDIVEAMRLHKEALMQSSIDPKTGMIDINILVSGYTMTDRHVCEDLVKKLKTYLDAQSKVVKVHQYHNLLSTARKLLNNDVTTEIFDSVLTTLQDDHIISMSDSKAIRYMVT